MNKRDKYVRVWGPIFAALWAAEWTWIGTSADGEWAWMRPPTWASRSASS